LILVQRASITLVTKKTAITNCTCTKKNTEQKSCSTIPKNKGAFVAVTSALVDFHYLTLVVEFQVLAFKNQSEYYNCIAKFSLSRADQIQRADQKSAKNFYLSFNF